jgi:Secretion system C-terminal sorting domain
MTFMFNYVEGQPDHFAYAITSINKGGSEWVALRKLDTRTGEFSSILRNVQDSSVAAIAYDRKSNRLYYTPMNIDQLHYIDLSTMETFAVSDQFFSKACKYDLKNTGPVNRMVIAPDEFGYTITNDGNHLIRFTTNGSPVITDMGDLMDDPQNKEMTIHSICANSGGDLVADDNGHLYLITGSNKVFKVDIATKMTSYLGTVSGLPQKFTTSGVAVTENGKQLIVTSTVYTDTYFLIDPATWNATPAQTKYELFESADLANSNVLYSNTTGYTNLFIGKSDENLKKIKIYPNPVMDDIVNLQFNELQPGNYTIQLADVVGRIAVQQKITIIGNTQTEIMHIPPDATQGFYYIRILDEKNNEVGTQKLIVERW